MEEDLMRPQWAAQGLSTTRLWLAKPKIYIGARKFIASASDRAAFQRFDGIGTSLDSGHGRQTPHGP